jgi:hypothetical protein
MPHESVTDDYIAELEARFSEAAQEAKDAPDWHQNQKLMGAKTYPLTIAMQRVKEGWTRQEIEDELKVRSVFGDLTDTVIGDNQTDDPQ